MRCTGCTVKGGGSIESKIKRTEKLLVTAIQCVSELNLLCKFNPTTKVSIADSQAKCNR